MIPAAFDYVRVDSVDEAIAQITDAGDEAKFLAGGHSLLPLMKLRLAQPSLLVDVGRLSELSYIRDAGDHIAIGALTRHHDIEHSALLVAHVPLLAYGASLVGDPAVRHRGTIGGSVAHSDPASDLPALLLALGATFIATSSAGKRSIPAAEFFIGFLSSALEPTELLTEIQVPKAPGTRWSYVKFNRRAQDWAIVGVAAVWRDDRPGIGLVNMGATPLFASEAAAAWREGSSPNEVADLVLEEAEPQADSSATVEYRRHLAKTLTRRALAQADDTPTS